MSDVHGAVPSPCIEVCVLDADGLCTGCLRTLEEISEWSVLADAGRREVLARISRRRAARAAAGKR